MLVVSTLRHRTVLTIRALIAFKSRFEAAMTRADTNEMFGTIALDHLPGTRRSFT